MCNNPVVLITGATRNIGFAIAKRFAKEGYNVCITSRKQDAADASAAEIQAEYPDVVVKGYSMITEDPDSIHEVFENVRKEFLQEAIKEMER